MKTSRILSNGRKALPARAASQGRLVAGLLILLGLGWAGPIGRAQPSDDDGSGVQVLTRGPVHEAFAGMVVFNPEPGIEVTKAPPDAIEEVPPEERPEGDNVAWIPGYWAWDDERNDFLWISGTWRALPPGREWMAGYWAQTAQGYQWISGYWADANARETTYLPAPPETVETGPNIAAPSVDYDWTPGCWIWYRERYAWRPGYWTQGRADWDWIPAHYVWTPRGYIFVEGFWDYPVERRGILFAPIYFESGVYSRRGYSYSPTIVLNLSVFSDHLFLRPRYQHYYFGDYYAASYDQGGFYASFSFQSSRRGYDPFYSRQRWQHRQDRGWAHRVEASHLYRRDHETARPPRTWAAQRNLNPDTAESRQNRGQVAVSINQLARRPDSPLRFQPVAREERQKLVRRGQEVQQSRDQRRTLEARAGGPAARKPGGAIEPVRVPQPRSPIVGRPANQLGGNQAPPRAPQAPKPGLKLPPRAETPGRQPDRERGNSQAEQRVMDSAAKAREGSQRNAQELDRKAQQESGRRAAEAAAKIAEEAQRNAREADRKAQPESPARAKDPPVTAREESRRNPPTPVERKQKEPEESAREVPVADDKGAARKEPRREGRGKPPSENPA